MQKWAYRFVIAERQGKGVFGFTVPREISWKVHYVNGKQQRNWQEMSLFNYLEKAGHEGWELVTLSTHVSMRSGTFPVEHIYAILKKPE